MFVGQHLDGGCLTLYNYISHISAHGWYVKMNQPHRMIPKFPQWTMLHDLRKFVQKEQSLSQVIGGWRFSGLFSSPFRICPPSMGTHSRCSKAIIAWWTILSTKRGPKNTDFIVTEDWQFIGHHQSPGVVGVECWWNAVLGRYPNLEPLSIQEFKASAPPRLNLYQKWRTLKKLAFAALTESEYCSLSYHEYTIYSTRWFTNGCG